LIHKLVRKRAPTTAGERNEPSGALAQASSAVSRVGASIVVGASSLGSGSPAYLIGLERGVSGRLVTAGRNLAGQLGTSPRPDGTTFQPFALLAKKTKHSNRRAILFERSW
jgi:hypothetical protein